MCFCITKRGSFGRLIARGWKWSSTSNLSDFLAITILEYIYSTGLGLIIMQKNYNHTERFLPSPRYTHSKAQVVTIFKLAQVPFWIESQVIQPNTRLSWTAWILPLFRLITRGLTVSLNYKEMRKTLFSFECLSFLFHGLKAMGGLGFVLNLSLFWLELFTSISNHQQTPFLDSNLSFPLFSPKTSYLSHSYSLMYSLKQNG